MSQYTTPLEVQNKMSAHQLIQTEKATLDINPNPKKNGKLFFTCGSKTGYITPALLAVIDTVSLDDITYAELRKPGQTEWIPTINLKMKAKRSLGAELL